MLISKWSYKMLIKFILLIVHVCGFDIKLHYLFTQWILTEEQIWLRFYNSMNHFEFTHFVSLRIMNDMQNVVCMSIVHLVCLWGTRIPCSKLLTQFSAVRNLNHLFMIGRHKFHTHFYNSKQYDPLIWYRTVYICYSRMLLQHQICFRLWGDWIWRSNCVTLLLVMSDF
jgi:hypothetical protein